MSDKNFVRAVTVGSLQSSIPYAMIPVIARIGLACQGYLVSLYCFGQLCNIVVLLKRWAGVLCHRSDGIASLGTPSSPFAPTDSASAASASNDSANQHSGIAIAAGLHCILMRPTEKVPRKLPELLGKVPGSSDRPTRIHLDNYTLAQLVGEVRDPFLKRCL